MSSPDKRQLTDKNMGHFLEHQDDNKELKEMKHQLTEMDHDYDVMLRERIESKKQLEAKFHGLSDPVLGETRSQALVQACRALSQASEVRSLARLAQP